MGSLTRRVSCGRGQAELLGACQEAGRCERIEGRWYGMMVPYISSHVATLGGCPSATVRMERVERAANQQPREGPSVLSSGTHRAEVTWQPLAASLHHRHASIVAGQAQ